MSTLTLNKRRSHCLIGSRNILKIYEIGGLKGFFDQSTG